MRAAGLALLLSLLAVGAALGSDWRPIATPAVAAELDATWIEIDAPNQRKLVAAVFTPSGTGPFPVVVLHHSSGGFSLRSTRLGEEFARAGFLTVAGCWFAGASPYNPPLPPLVDCPAGPPFYGATLFALPYVDAITQAARSLPGAKRDKVGLIGQSRGATMAVLQASNGGNVQAVVADSANYTPRRPIDAAAIDSVRTLAAPLLILHGTKDETVSIHEPREYEAALVRLGKPFEARYYENSEHVLTRRNNSYYADALERSVAFFAKHLGR